MSTTDLAKLRAAISAEEERLQKRPVPTEPWAMPLGLRDLLALVDAVEAAQALDALTPTTQSFFLDAEFHAAAYTLHMTLRPFTPEETP